MPLNRLIMQFHPFLKYFFPYRPSPSLSSAPDLSPGEPSTLSFYPIPTGA